MNDLLETLKEMKKDLADLGSQIEGASYMLHMKSPHRDFLNYLKGCMRGMHDKLAFEIKTNSAKTNTPIRKVLADIKY